MHIQHLEL